MKALKIIGWLSVSLITIFLLTGCGILPDFRKEPKEEKKILGYVQGYNPKVKEIEKVLKDDGFSPGAIDGIMDKGTRKAIRDFQKANKLKETGFIDGKTMARLDVVSFEKERARAQESKAQARPSKGTKKAQSGLKKSGYDAGKAPSSK